MERKPVTRIARVKALTNPLPLFVSMVTAGANQTPYRTVKADSRVRVNKKEWAPMLKALKADGHDIKQLFFPSDKYNLSTVQKWLQEGGYEAAEPQETDHGFTVTSAKSFAEGTERTVDLDNDVQVTVAMLSDAAEQAAVAKAEGDEKPTPKATDAHSSVQPVAKADDAQPAAEQPADEAGAKEAEAGAENAEKAETPAADAEAGAAVQPLSERTVKSMYAVRELGTLVQSAMWLAEEYNFEGEETSPAAQAIKDAAQNLVTAFSLASGEEVKQLRARLKSDAPAAQEAPENAAADTAATPVAGEGDNAAGADATGAEKGADTTPAPAPDDAPAQGDENAAEEGAGEPTLAAVLKAISELTASVKNATAVAEEARQIAGAAQKREEKTEKSDSITRRSEDVDGPEAGSSETTGKDEEEQRRTQRSLANTIGI
jgi:hypothetical protein